MKIENLKKHTVTGSEGNNISQNIVQRISLSDKAIEIIKEQIIGMEFQLGEKLVVDKIANQLRISRTPVRDALKTLVQQGLVTYDGIHYSIVKPNQKEMEDLFSVRAVLEGLATRQAIIRADRKVLEKFVNDFQQKTASLKVHKDSAKLVETDIFLHTKIVDFANNYKLTNLLNIVREQCWLIRRWSISEEDDILEEIVREEHNLILANMLDGNINAAGENMEIHLINSWKRIVKLPFLED